MGVGFLYHRDIFSDVHSTVGQTSLRKCNRTCPKVVFGDILKDLLQKKKTYKFIFFFEKLPNKKIVEKLLDNLFFVVKDYLTPELGI